MISDSEIVITIVGMALVTYLTRIGGPLLLSRFKLSRRIETWLTYVPGSVLVALVAPGLIAAGIPGLIAGVGTVAVARRTNNLLLALVVGVGLVWLLRQWL